VCILLAMGVPFALYFVLSTLAGGATVSYACYTREQFYPIILFLVTSKLSFLVAANLVVAFGIVFGKVLKSVYFGRLRDTEVEQLVERCKYSIMETCLALTIFRHELTPFVLLLFGFLLFTKVFHWLCRGRIDHLEQVVPVPVHTHLRMQFLLFCLILVDVAVAYRCIEVTILAGNKSVLLLFGFEFVVLLIGAFNYAVRYALLVADSVRENGLQYKGFYIMILDILCDGLKFVIYVAFFSLVFVHYGLPIHIVREVWICFLTFQQRLLSFIRYMRLTRRLDERLEDASPEEIEHAGNCLICREAMTSGKKLSCSHVFHIDCLRMWLQHQQSCPLCRTEIKDSRPVPAEVAAAAAADAAAARPGVVPPVDGGGIAPAPPVAVAGAGAGVAGVGRDAAAARDAATASSSQSSESSVPGFFIVTADHVVLYSSPTLRDQMLTVYPKVAYF
jgi:E3 ubiquitin-protein ligase synoviolin